MLALEEVSVTYNAGTPAAVHALVAVSLHVPAGQFVTVVGANGSGKSTLASVVAGSVPPTAGRVVVDGHDVTHLPVHQRAGAVSRVFDDPRAGSATTLSVEENLALAMARGRRRGLRPAVTRQRRRVMREALATLGLGLEDRLHQPVGLLSAGQRQSLTLVMAALRDPSVLLLDEHLAALDPTTAQRVLSLTTALAAQAGSTTVMVTHDMQAALATGDRLLVMRDGSVATDLTGTDRQSLDANALAALLRARFGHQPPTAATP